MSAGVHISSLVVHARPQSLDAVATAVNGLVGAEVHGTSKQGKMVVTLETDSEAQMLARIDAMNAIEGVLSVALVFHQVEESAGSA